MEGNQVVPNGILSATLLLMFKSDPDERSLRRARIAWCAYDWANSAFPTVIVTFVFSVYFVQGIASDEITGTAQWGYALSVSGVFIALFSPVLGAIADSTGRRKIWLGFFSAMLAICAGSLWFAQPNPSFVFYALIMFGCANISFEVGQVFYNAMLPDIVSREKIGRLSGWGWSSGYMGGLACLVILLIFFLRPEVPPLGLNPRESEQVRIVGPVVAVWFTLFCLPLFLCIPDSKSRSSRRFQAAFAGVKALISTMRTVRRHKNIAWFLCARIFYVDGINTMFAFGAVYASGTFGMSTEEVVLFAIAITLAAGFGAAAFGWVADHIGSKRTIVIALFGLISLGTPLLVIETKLWFWLVGIPLGFFMGPAQAASRSLMAKIAPTDHYSEMFGLFAFSGRATAFVGPALLATFTAFFESQRIGMSVIVVFIGIGLAILYWKVGEK
ncbi:MAG: MFS transporter [Pseudomonadota bacterium]|nr:MFS transporter [Pseudomonadota bacterium]